MCMNSVKFALKYDKGAKDFVGYGYKALHPTTQKEYRNKWVEATGGTGSLKDENNLENACDKKQYIPGFHIWLNQADALSYANGDKSQVVKVRYRGVLAFGTNENGAYNKDYTPKYGPCLIARYMKIVASDQTGVE